MAKSQKSNAVPSGGGGIGINANRLQQMKVEKKFSYVRLHQFV